MSVSCTSNLLVQMFDFQKYTKVHLMLIRSLPDLLPNQSLDIILISIVVLYFTQNHIVGIHLYDECKKSNAPNVCHMFLSISSPHEQALFTDHNMSGLPIRTK